MAKRETDSTGRPTEASEQVAYWLTELKACKKREKKFRKSGDDILELYDGTKSRTTPFNILFSNTETLLPACYSTVPRPVVQRRFKDDDPMGKAASTAGVRMLEFLSDTNWEGYDPLDTVLRHTTLDGLLPGRGVSVVKYDSDIQGQEQADGPEEGADSAPSMTYELVCLQTKVWSRFYMGYAKKWSSVPWIAFEDYIDKAEATRLFGARIANQMRFTKERSQEQDDETPKPRDEKEQGERKTACLYQIWDKLGGKMVRYMSPAYTEGMLKEEEDPLGLSGFYPCPKPLQFIEKTHSLVPTAPYTLYENQAAELNEIQRRISAIVRAMKARGIYDGALSGDVQKLLEADDLDMVPAESNASLAAEKGLQNAIWMWPLETLVAALQQLYQARESCKQVIYEITGISDILRGASQASETATAQTIKNQWGTLRLKRLQKEVARYARDLLRLMLELAAAKFSEETWARMTGLPFLTTEQAQQAQQMATIAQQMGQPLDPQTQAALQAPVWGQILALLKDDLARAYRIDIETNSTVEPEAAEDQKNITDLLTALGQTLQGIAPLVVNGSMPFEVAKSLLLTVSRRFRFGEEIEDDLKQMQPPKPEGDDGKAQQQQLQQQQAAATQSLQLQQQKMEMDLESQKMQAEKDILIKKIDLELREIQLKADEEKFQLLQQVAQEKLAMRDQVHTVKKGADDQVRSLKEAGSKKEAQSAHMADTKLSGSVTAIQEAAKSMVAINDSLLKAIQGQSEQTAQVLTELTAAMKAPKIKKAIRGKDGRIESVQETTA